MGGALRAHVLSLILLVSSVPGCLGPEEETMENEILHWLPAVEDR